MARRDEASPNFARSQWSAGITIRRAVRVALLAVALTLTSAGIALSASGKLASHPGHPASQLPLGAKAVANGRAPHAVTRAAVTNRALVYPTVDINATPTTAAKDQPILFDGSGSSDSGGIASYEWDFGDGTTKTGAVVSHSYQFAGPKHVTLYVTGNDGLTSSSSVDVSITGATSIQPLPGCWTSHLNRNDDYSSPAPVPLGFTLDFFGKQHESAWINNNGNITFDQALSDYTPYDLSSTPHEMIAPFFADVDTRAAGSDRVTYGQTTVGGRPAFCVNWGGEGGGVGYFGMHADKLNRFQLLLIDRSDLGPGDFDMQMNYDQVQWETGDASEGSSGKGGTSARVGYTNGSGDTGTFFEAPGSAMNGAFLDGGPDSLRAGSRGSTVTGRYIYEVRNGQPPTGGQIQGHVTADGDPSEGAPVQACPTSGAACVVTHSSTSGSYLLAGLANGQYTLTALPPESDSAHGPITVGPVTVPVDGSVTTDLALTAIHGPPSGTTITSIDTGDNGEPILYWEDVLTLTTRGCPEGHGAYRIIQDGHTLRSGVLTRSSVTGGLGVFTGTIAPLAPDHGDVVFNVSVTGCSDSSRDQQTSWNAYVDPSGTVKTTHGQPVAGATMTLYRSDSSAGPFSQVADGSSVMSPVNRENPDASDARGLFGWDVLAGYYQVRATKSGCHDPSQPANDFVQTGVLTIPPPVTGLKLVLDCGAGIDTPASVGFGQQQVGTAGAAHVVKVRNVGPGPLTVDAPTIRGAAAGDFAVSSNGCVPDVPTGGSCSISVVFKPSAVGTRAAALSIPSNGAASASSVALSGQGAARSQTPPSSPAPPGSHSPSSTPTPTRGAPKVSNAALRGIAKGHPKLTFSVRRGDNGAPPLVSLKVSLPPGLSFKRSAFTKHRHCHGHGKHRKCVTTVVVRGLSVKGAGTYKAVRSHGKLRIALGRAASEVRVTASSKLIGASKRLRKQVKRHKVKRVRVTVSATDSKHHTTTLHTRLKVT